MLGALLLLAFSLGNAMVGFSSSNEAVAAVGKTLAAVGAILAVLALATWRYFRVDRW